MTDKTATEKLNEKNDEHTQRFIEECKAQNYNDMAIAWILPIYKRGSVDTVKYLSQATPPPTADLEAEAHKLANEYADEGATAHIYLKQGYIEAARKYSGMVKERTLGDIVAPAVARENEELRDEIDMLKQEVAGGSWALVKQIEDLTAEIVTLKARNAELRELFKQHLDTMEAVNQHFGYQFSQPLIAARELLAAIRAKEYAKVLAADTKIARAAIKG